MKAIDKIFGGLVIGFIIPIVGLCIFWWGSYLLKLNIGSLAVFGLVLGIFADFVLLRMLVSRMYSFNTGILITIFIIYSVGIFGFFMGVPVFNIAAGIMAAFYIGRRKGLEGVDKAGFKTAIEKTNYFSALVLVIICICSAFLALNDPYTAANLEGMLNLSFDITKGMLWSLVIVGGAALIAAQYAISMLVGKLAYNLTGKL